MKSRDPDEGSLSAWERERLAGIERELALSDPRLTRRLAGFRRADLSVLAALVLVVLGATTAVATFTRWLWMASTGLVVMATGMALVVNRLLLRRKRRRAGPSLSPEP